MAFEQKDMTGAMFKNKKKTRDTHPDYTGSIKVDGTEFWISGWINTPKGNPNGDKYMSLSVSVKETQPAASTTTQPSRPSSFDDFDDDVPF